VRRSLLCLLLSVGCTHAPDDADPTDDVDTDRSGGHTDVGDTDPPDSDTDDGVAGSVAIARCTVPAGSAHTSHSVWVSTTSGASAASSAASSVNTGAPLAASARTSASIAADAASRSTALAVTRGSRATPGG
jgi:hypothetical protein